MEPKQTAALRALEEVEDGMLLGLGTGSTAAFYIDALGERVRAGLSVTAVATSKASALQAAGYGITLQDSVDRPIDLTVDGADEIGPGLALIKGGGGALLREKLVWEASRRCVVIADETKRVAMLGRYPLPIEVVPFGHTITLRRIIEGLADCGVAARPQLRHRDGAPFVTDSGNLLYDAPCGAILDPTGVEAALKSITGVVEHGLFLDLADLALIGGDAGVTRLEP